MKRIIIILVLLALSMNLFAAAESTTITYWHHDASENIVKAMTKLNKIFEEKNPDIKIKFLALPADSFFEKYIVAVATGTAPDAFGIRMQELAAMISQGALEPLDDYVNKWEEFNNIEAAALEPVRGASIDGKLYMLPGYTNVNVNWYNTKLMNELGVKIPRNIDEFLAACKNNADDVNGKYFYTFRGGKGAWSNMFPFILSYSGTKSFFDNKGKSLINTPENIEGLKKYIEIYKNNWCSKDGINNSYKEMVLEFGSGTAMMMTHNSSSLPEHMKNLGEGNFMLGPASFTGKGGISAVAALEPIGASISSTSKNKEAALKLVEFYASAEAMSIYCEAVGKVPVNTGIYSDSWYANSPYMTAISNILADKNIVWFQLPNYLDEWADFANSVDADIQAMCLGELEPENAIANWSNKLDEYQIRYQANK